MDVFRQGFTPAVLLASFGVLITAAIVALVAMPVMQLGWRHALLLGAIVASTDAAAVFSLLRHVGLRLNERVAATLEIESGLNDPMAVFMVLALTASIGHGAGAGAVVLLLVEQAGFGLAVGWFGAQLVAWLGLRGAVPIVLALFPVIEKVPGTSRFFDVAFAVVLMSLLLQGTTLGWAAKHADVVEEPDPATADKRPVQGRLTLDGEQPL